jgi:DNA modification methylase
MAKQKTKPEGAGGQSAVIEQIPTVELVPYARNSRTHSDEQVAQIAASIREFGFCNPVLIDAEGTIIAGHGRVMAATRMKLETVPCLRLSHLTDAQKRAYVIADNRIALSSGWDEAMLANELSDLHADEFDLSVLGFDADELTALMDLDSTGEEEPSGEIVEDEVPEVPVDPITKPGNLWILGEHRLLCGDSTKAEDVERLMDGAKAQLIHADPPYGMGKECDGVQNDNLYDDKLDAFQMAWWRAFRKHTDDNGSAYIWGNAEGLWRLWYIGGLKESERLTFRSQVIWNKPPSASAWGSPIGSEKMRSYPHGYEVCLFFMLGEQGFNNNADNYWDGWEPIRSYLETEMKRCGWTIKDLNRITGTQMAGHWVTRSQWSMITEQHYEAIQQAAKEHAAFKQEHAAFKQEHDKLKQDFYATRAYFDNAHENMTDVWEFPRVTGEERHGHATPKPVAMMVRAIRSSCPDGGIVAEPFGGSGSTLIAAEHCRRRCFTMELSPAYCDVIVKRWENLTGKTAVLETT